MKSFINVLLGIVACSFSLLAQESPVEIEASFTGDAVRNFSGGIKKGHAYLGLFDASLGFDTEKAGLWSGGSIFVHSHVLFGGSPSANLLGDAQVATNIEGQTNKFIYEVYYKQVEGKFSGLAGLHNMNSVFFVSEMGGLFLNSSFGIGPNFSLNHFVSIFPLTTLGAVFEYKTDVFGVAAGVYNHGLDFVNESYYQFKNHLFQQGVYSIIECSITPQTSSFGPVYKLGANYRYCNDNELIINGDLNSRTSMGVYALADQPVFETEAGQTLGIFAQAGFASQKNDVVPFYFAGGFHVKGIKMKHGEALAGLAIASARIKEMGLPFPLKPKYGNETAIELTFNAPVHSQITLQPDVQYIINPGGTNSLSNALAGMLRLGLSF